MWLVGELTHHGPVMWLGGHGGASVHLGADYRVGMTRRFNELAVVSLLATAFALLAPSGAQSIVAPVVPGPPLGGVNATGIAFGTPTARVNQEIAWAHSLGAHAIRVEIPWSTLEPTRGQIEPQALAFTDNLVNQASAAGIKVVALAMWTPCWASSAPVSLLRKCRPHKSGRAQAWPPVDPNTYASFTAFLAGRYGAKLAAIEVWNEPDQANEDYFAGPNKAQRYAAVLRAAYPAIKRADPEMPVLGGSLVGSNGAFLRALYAAGIKGYYDGLSVHFYNLVLASLRYLHQVQLANHDSKPLWLNEFGWSSCWPRQRIQQEQGCVTKQAQGANLANVFRSLARTPWVAAEMVYTLQGSRSEDFGVLTETGAHKPSFGVLRSVFISPFGKPSPVKVHLSRHGGRVVASGSGPVGDYLQLEVFSGRRAVYRAQFTLDRFNRYSIALPRVLGTQNLRVSVFQYWMGTAKAASASI
jgi:polysaccharide biosynthesis protein PslG